MGERDGEGSATPDADRERVQVRAALDRLALNQRDAFCALVLRTFFSPSPSSRVARSLSATMATFSPAPRRTARYSSIGMSPSPPRQGPTRRTRAGSAQPQSRFSTPRRGNPLAPVRDDESIASGSGMDVDMEAPDAFEPTPRSDTVFSKSKEMSVTFYAQLPMEVRQALRNAGMSLHGL